MDFEKRTCDAWLASAEIPYDSLIPLLHGLKGSEQVYHAWRRGENACFRLVPDSCRRKLSESAGEDRMTALQSVLKKHGIQTVTILEEGFPRILSHIPDPPGILLFQGNGDCMKPGKRAAMIGSRNASWAGLKAARKIGAELSRNGVNIISGLALGIDTESHRGCLEGGSPTIAVMGCGLDRTYPAENDKLKTEIMDKGGLISLTDKGYPIARRIYDRHLTLTRFFTSIGVNEAIARKDACKVEHDISEETFSMICKQMEKN